jgi:ABC-type uncharacterized transport system ATPase subunit
MPEPLAAMRGITKFIYGGDGRPLRNTDVKILEDVDFDLFAGEVHVLVGENGAGKSTLMKILGGIIPPDRGELKISGATVSLTDARDARRKGVAFIHQELNLCRWDRNPSVATDCSEARVRFSRIFIGRTRPSVLWSSER